MQHELQTEYWTTAASGADQAAAVCCMQSTSALRDHLKKYSNLPYSSRLADIHLLLWLAGQPNLDQTDLLAVTEAVRDKSELMEGYKVIIDSIAGI